MRRLLALAALALLAPALPLRAQQPAAGTWSALFAASGARGTLPAAAAPRRLAPCLPNGPDSLRLVPREDSVPGVARIAVLDAGGRWRDTAATGGDSLRVRVVGALCGGRRGETGWLSGLVLEHDGAFLRYTRPGPGVRGDAFPQLRMSYPRAAPRLAYSPLLGWLGSARILQDAGEWTPEQIAAARAHRVLLGMKTWMVFISLGRAIRTNLTVWNGFAAEEWTYPNGTVDFRDGKVSAIRLP